MNLARGVELGHEAITPWKGRDMRAIVQSKKREDEDSPNPRFKKERNHPYVNNHRDRLNSALRSGLDYELHHGRIDSHPSGGGAYSRPCSPDPRTPTDVESALHEAVGAVEMIPRNLRAASPAKLRGGK